MNKLLAAAVLAAAFVMDDCLIIGGGVIGLSLAYELSAHGLRVRLVDRRAPGAEASWAGAGILPPPRRPPLSPLDDLSSLSMRLHPQWAARLRDETGIDNEFWRCGAWYLSVRDEDPQLNTLESAGEVRLPTQEATSEAQPVMLSQVVEREPALADACGSGHINAAGAAEDECQLRNPLHLKALVAACRRRGVAIEPDIEVTGFWTSGHQVVGAQTSSGPRFAGSFCIANGAWAARLAHTWNMTVSIKPIRGQMVLLRHPEPALRRIVNVGKRYLVPRRDGRVLVGSTEEDVGFDRQTTDEGIAGLLRFARTLIPAWSSAEVERTWAGLRPATEDGLPYLCRAPELGNAFLTAGHFRNGIYLSPATAVVMSELMRDATTSVDLTPFCCNRSGASQ